MKTFFLTILFASCCLSFFNSCKTESGKGTIDEKAINACGVTYSQKNLPWLAELIEKAEKDKTAGPYKPGDSYKPGHYTGCIWLEKYKEQDIFITDMMLGSGGVAYWFFDCSGNHLVAKKFKNEHCPACEFVGNNHFFIEDEDFQYLVSNMKLDVIVYSPF
jgi:hypothetical protein